MSLTHFFQYYYNIIRILLVSIILTTIILTASTFGQTDNFENHPGGNLSIAGDENSMQWTTTIINDRAICQAQVVEYNEPNEHWALIKAGVPYAQNPADPGCTAKMKNSNIFEPFTNSLSFKSYIYVYGDGGGLPEFSGHATMEVKFYDTDGILQNTLTRTCYSNPFRAARPCTSAPTIKKYEYKVISGTLYENVDGTSTSIGEFHGTGYIGYIEFQADIHRVGYAGGAEATMYIDNFSTSAEHLISGDLDKPLYVQPTVSFPLTKTPKEENNFSLTNPGLIFLIIMLLFSIGIIIYKEKNRIDYEKLQISKGLIKYPDEFGNWKWMTAQEIEECKRKSLEKEKKREDLERNRIEEEEKKKESFFKRVIEKIKGFEPSRKYGNEFGYHIELQGWLKAHFPSAKVEVQTGASRPDIIIDNIAIEVKGPTDNRALDTLTSKCLKYLNYYDNFIIVLFEPKFSEKHLDEIWESVKKHAEIVNMNIIIIIKNGNEYSYKKYEYFSKSDIAPKNQS